MCANTYHCPKKALSVSSLCKKGSVLGSAGLICLLHLNILFPTNTNSWRYFHLRPVSLLSDCSQEPIESKCESAKVMSNGLVQWFLTLTRHQSHLEGFLKQTSGPHYQSLIPTVSWWVLRIYISNKFSAQMLLFWGPH